MSKVDFKLAKEKYEEIEIPDELGERVQQTISAYEASHKEELTKSKVPVDFTAKKKSMRLIGKIAAVAAALLVVLTLGLNTSEVFATSMNSIPVVCGLTKFLTIRSYDVSVSDDEKIVVNAPELVADGLNDAYVNEFNEKLSGIIEQHKAEAKNLITEYRQAYFATGGTEDEWKAHDIQALVSCQVMSETDSTISFMVRVSENWAEAYNTSYYYNLDMKNEKEISLKELLGDDYINTANASIKKQIEERTASDSSLTYFDGSDGMEGFTTIQPDTKFYINEAGNPVIVFDKYEIAPGAMGVQEFEIAK